MLSAALLLLSNSLFLSLRLTGNPGSFPRPLPPEEERALYINEYMNVVCGRIVSKINTLTDSVSKLSVPEYFGENDPDYGRDEQAYHIMLIYRNGQGFVRFIIQFEFQQNGGDDV